MPDLLTPDCGRNMSIIGHSDQGGRADGIQIMVSGGYAYVGHVFNNGFSVMDVRDPKNPKFVKHIPQPEGTWSQHLQTHGDIMIDADEVLSEELQNSIMETKQNWEYDGYTFNRLTYYCGKWIKHCGWYPDTKLRLWDSSKGKWDGLNPHDQFFMQKGASIKHLVGDLFHYSYDSITEHVMVSQKYSEIMSQQLYDQGKKSSTIKIWINPLAKFIKVYFQKKGFKDGIYGLIISWIAAYSTFMKYALIRHLEKIEKSKADE